MGFPWKEMIDGLGFPIIITLISCAPIIVALLLGFIVAIIKKLFGMEDDD